MRSTRCGSKRLLPRLAAAVWVALAVRGHAEPPRAAAASPDSTTTIRDDRDRFAFEVSGDWTTLPLEGDEGPYVALRLRSGGPDVHLSPGAMMTVLHLPKDAPTAWETVLGEVAAADPIAQEGVASREGVMGWLWTVSSADAFDALVSFPESDGEWALHLRASAGPADWSERFVAASATFRRYDRNPRAMLSLQNVVGPRGDALLRAVVGDPSFHLTSIEDRGVLLHRLDDRAFSRAEIDAWSRDASDAMRVFEDVFYDGTSERPKAGLVVKLLDGRREYRAYGGGESDGQYSRDSKEIVICVEHGAAAARSTLSGLLWAWHIDVTFPGARAPRWLMYGYTSALQHARLSLRNAPTLQPQPWFAARARKLLNAGTLPTVRELVTTDYQSFASKQLTYPTATESLALYLLAVVPQDPALSRRFGGRLDQALWIGLHGAAREEVADAILRDDEVELDTAWRAWILAQ